MSYEAHFSLTGSVIKQIPRSSGDWKPYELHGIATSFNKSSFLVYFFLVWQRLNHYSEGKTIRWSAQQVFRSCSRWNKYGRSKFLTELGKNNMCIMRAQISGEWFPVSETLNGKPIRHILLIWIFIWDKFKKKVYWENITTIIRMKEAIASGNRSIDQLWILQEWKPSKNEPHHTTTWIVIIWRK